MNLADSKPLNPFRQQLIAVLDHFQDPIWLGEHSPLATAYFLGEYLLQQTNNNTPAGRGLALRSLLRETAESLAQDQEGKQFYTLLQRSFFRSQPIPQICSDLNISRATYYRYRAKAIELLEQRLVQHARPSLRLEDPPPKEKPLGREKAIDSCLETLQIGKTVAILGNIGVGKTMLGAHLARLWQPKSTFWFTLRPNLNDHLLSLLFSLGYFLQLQGASTLWLQLIANIKQEANKIDNEMFTGLVRYDLKTNNLAPPLLCFDDIDLLRPLEVERHALLHAFLQSLRGIVPIIFMGQRITLEVDHRQTLRGFSASDMLKFLTQTEIKLTPTERKTLSEFTQNIPYLLELFVILHRSGEPLADALSALSTAPSSELLLNRIWQRLTPEEIALLAQLSVFRRTVPDTLWSESNSCKTLVARGLILQGTRGELSLVPAIRSIIYAQLAAEDKEACHLKAAAIRADRADFTASAYHYIQGGQPNVAVRLWYEHRQQEVNQGQGNAALDLFSNVSANALQEEEREMLVLLRNQLRLLQGKYGEIKRDLHAMTWKNLLHQAQAKRIAGDAAYEKSQFDTAILAYQDSIATLRDVEHELAISQKEIAKAYAHKTDLGAAWRAALMAEYEVENMKGSIQSDQGNFKQAQSYLESALKLALELQHIEGEGKTRNNLAWVLKQQGEFEIANEHWKKAADCYQRVGRLTMQAGIKVNQASALTLTGKPETAISLLQEALTIFQSLGFSRGIAAAHYNLAETYLALGNLEAAEQSAWQSVEDEEPSVLPASLYVLAEIKFAQKQFKEAESFCQNAIAHADKIDNALIIAYARRTLGKIYLAQEQIEVGKEALNAAAAYFEEQDLAHELSATRQIMSDFQAKDKDVIGSRSV